MSSEPGSGFAKPALGLIALALVLVTAASIADGSIGPVLVLATAGVFLYFGTRRIAPRSELGWVMSVAFGAFALRSAVAALLVMRSLANGYGGFTTGDDIWYASAAGHVVEYLRGTPDTLFVPPYWNGEYYLMTTYVFVESAVFFVVGQHVLNMILVNSMIGAFTVVLVADMGMRMFGRGASIAVAAVLAVYPSVVVWSAVNLRDTMMILIVVATLWALLRMHERPSLSWILVAFLGAWAAEGLRWYVEAVLLMVALLAVLVTFAVKGPARRIRWPITAAALFVLLLVHSGLAVYVTDPAIALGSIGDVRAANQFGRTAFDAPPPAGTSSPGPSAIASASPTPSASSSTPAPVIAPTRVLRVDVDARTEYSRTLAHLPAGIMHTLFAPFPWAIQSAPELAAMPEMLLWYVILGALLRTLWIQRRRWEWFLPEVLFLGALLLLLSLGEGNIGTLFRHRAMAVPAAILLAGPSLAVLGRRVLTVFGRAPLGSPNKERSLSAL